MKDFIKDLAHLRLGDEAVNIALGRFDVRMQEGGLDYRQTHLATGKLAGATVAQEMQEDPALGRETGFMGINSEATREDMGVHRSVGMRERGKDPQLARVAHHPGVQQQSAASGKGENGFLAALGLDREPAVGQVHIGSAQESDSVAALEGIVTGGVKGAVAQTDESVGDGGEDAFDFLAGERGRLRSLGAGQTGAADPIRAESLPGAPAYKCADGAEAVVASARVQIAGAEELKKGSQVSREFCNRKEFKDESFIGNLGHWSQAAKLAIEQIIL